jgi:hypothetical protein
VPSLRHSSSPAAAVVAAKKRLPSNAVMPLGFESSVPAWMSLTIAVPALVPSLRQSSEPCVASAAPR